MNILFKQLHHLQELSDHVHIALDRAGTIQALLEALQDSPTATKIQKKYYRLYSQELFLNQFSTISFFYDCESPYTIYFFFPQKIVPLKIQLQNWTDLNNKIVKLKQLLIRLR